MSIADYILSWVINFFNGILSNLPVNFSGLSLTDYQTTLNGFFSTLQHTYNFLNAFIPVQLLFTLLIIIIIAEILLHAGWKSIKWLINVIRGSGA